MSKFNETTKGADKTENLAGGVAYSHSPELELVMSVLSTFLEDKFYESGEDRMIRLKDLISKVNPIFVAKLAIVAREQFYLRSVSHLLVAELSRIHRGDNLVSKTLIRVAQRPDDLTEIVSYLGKPLPKQIKKGVRRALLKFDGYQLAKYKATDKKVSLVDLFNLAHPNPKFVSAEVQKAWKDLIDGKLKNKETWESRLSSGEDKEQVWADLVLEGKIGYMALLRNLRNIDKSSNDVVVNKACEMISNPDAVKKSKQLPFRFFSAYQNVENQDMLEAISQALDISLDNVPTFDGKTLVAVDTSGSMTCGDTVDKASIFAGALFKKNDADVVLYDTTIRNIKLLRQDSTLSIVEKIKDKSDGGGTNTSLVFQYASKSEIKYDRIIILSDNQSWQDNGWGGDTQVEYKKYRKINDCNVYAIDIAGYGTKDIKSEKVFHVGGWSEKIFDFIQWIEKENQLVDFINKIEI